MLRHEEDTSISINIKPWKKYYAKKCNSKKSNLLLSPHFFEQHELEIIASRLPKRSDLLHKTNRMMSLEKNVEPAPNESLRSKLRRISQYTMEDLEAILKLFQPGSFLYIRTFQLISFLKTREIRLLKLPKQDTTCYFSDLTEEQLMPSFAEVAKFRFVLCKVLLTYNSDDAKPRTYYKGHSACPYTYDLPKGTAHGTMVGSGHQLFGSIQAAAFSLDPASPPFNIFNHKYNDPIAVPKLGFLSPHCICYCSIPFSTSIKIAANLHVTTDKVDDVDTKEEYRSSFGTAHEKQFNDAFEICNGSAVINSSDCFAKRPNGGSYSYTLNGRDGHLKLYYLALKYVVDAALEVVFVATCEETKVAGRVMAYYGKKFDYGCSPAELDDYKVLYEESSKKFAEDAEFRERTQPVQDWDERHKSAWEQICTISQKRYRKVYQRLGIHVKEEGKILHGSYIRKTRKLLRKEGYNTKSGDEAIVIEGRKLRLVDFAALWPSLELGKVDRIVHVADVGQRDKIEMCITVAESVGCRVTNQCHDPLSHVGYVQVKGFEGYGLVQLLDEAKSRCKAVLVGKAGEELKHTAEALGYGAVKYEVLKNNRLTDYSFSFDDMLKEMGNTAVYLQKTHARICSSMENIRALAGNLLTLKGCLTLKDDRERELGLHLLRFTEVLGEVCRVLAPHILCDYLFVLCDKFNGLYSDSRHRQVLRSDEDSKILLFQATRVVIAKCFEFLGITPIYDNFSTIK